MVMSVTSPPPFSPPPCLQTPPRGSFQNTPLFIRRLDPFGTVPPHCLVQVFFPPFTPPLSATINSVHRGTPPFTRSVSSTPPHFFLPSPPPLSWKYFHSWQGRDPPGLSPFSLPRLPPFFFLESRFSAPEPPPFASHFDSAFFFSPAPSPHMQGQKRFKFAGFGRSPFSPPMVFPVPPLPPFLPFFYRCPPGFFSTRSASVSRFLLPPHFLGLASNAFPPDTVTFFMLEKLYPIFSHPEPTGGMRSFLLVLSPPYSPLFFLFGLP